MVCVLGLFEKDRVPWGTRYATRVISTHSSDSMMMSDGGEEDVTHIEINIYTVHTDEREPDFEPYKRKGGGIEAFISMKLAHSEHNVDTVHPPSMVYSTASVL